MTQWRDLFMAGKQILQFKITLLNVPTIWRRIQIADSSTFWDFHVAIQDAMGWTDSHLHEFSIINPLTLKKEFIGIPDDEGLSDYITLTGWEFKVRDYIKLNRNQEFTYLYDFGDSWEHWIEFEGEHEKQQTKYPKCLEGERACPPEDVGGTPGYENFLDAIKDPQHQYHDQFIMWVGGTFDPEKFDFKKVKFHNPKTRWKRVFEDDIEF